MASEKMDFELILSRLSDLEKLYTGFQKSSKAAKEVTEASGKMAKQISTAVTQAQKLQQALSKASGGLGVGQIEKTLARGNPLNALKSASVTGQLRDFEAQFDQMFARINNKFAAGMKNTVRSVTSNQIVSLASRIQSNPSGNLATLTSQIEAQKYRVAQAQIKIDQLKGGRDYIYERALTKEKLALDGLVRKKEELLLVEKKLRQERNRQDKVDNLLGDGGASLFRIQAGLLVNYQLMTQLFNLFQFGTQYVIQFDKALREVQAVTDTTNTEMQSLSRTFVEVSQSTKFSAVELAQAGLILGQAGLSAKQINESIESVAKLATASGSDLATSVDVVTSALTVFNMNATETEHVANTMTAALNLTKLSMDKLQLGIQYAGNAAAESGITLEELVASLGAMANAGIKSGSTLGTGLTQVIVELQNPSKKLSEELKSVGLTMTDVDVKAKGLTGVLETMREAGFGSANAFRSMDLRAARAYLALSRNTDTARDMEVALQLSAAAAKANDTQMLSLANSGAKLKNTFGAFLLEFAEPFKNALIAVTNSLSSMLSVLNQFPATINLIGTLLLTAFSVRVVTVISNLILNLGLFRTSLLKTIPLLVGFTRALVGAESATAAAAVTTGRLTTAFRILGLTGVGRIATLIATVVAGLGIYSSFSSTAADETDRLQASMDEAKGAFDSTAQTIESVDTEISRLINRYESLDKNSDALGREVISMQVKFGEFTDGLRLNTIKTVDDLIKVLRDLRGEMSSVASEQVELMRVAQSNKFIKDAQNISEEYSDTRITAYGTNAQLSRKNFGNFARKLSGVSIDKLATNELNDLIKDASNQWSNINSETRKLTERNNEIQILLNKNKNKEIKISSFKIGTLEKELEYNQQELNKNKQASPKAFAIQSELINAMDLRRKAISTDIEKTESLSLLDKQILEARAALSKAKSTGNRAKIQEAKNNLISMRKNVDRASADIALSVPYSTEEIGNVLMDRVETQINEAISDAGIAYENLSSAVGKSHKEYLGKITEKQKLSLEQLRREVELSTLDTQNKMNAIDAAVAEMDAERGGLRGLYSDAEQSIIQDFRKANTTQQYADKAAAIENLLPKLAELVKQQEEVYLKAKKASDASPKDGAKLQAAIDTYRDYNSAIDEEIKFNTELLELRAKLDASTGKEILNHYTLSEQIADSLNKYREQMIIQDDLGLNIKANITNSLDGARESFGSFLRDWINGTSTAGNAFKAFGYKVLETLQEMAIKSATNSIFSGIIGLVTRNIGSNLGTNLAISQSIAANPAIFNAGGAINRRAASGMAVNTRDSVPVVVRPGEYILRNSAVDAIGKENLDQINAYGNRAVQRSANSLNNSSMYQMSNKSSGNPVNVYVVSPEAKPTLTRNDVLVTIQQDILKNGTTAQLIKTVVPK